MKTVLKARDTPHLTVLCLTSIQIVTFTRQMLSSLMLLYFASGQFLRVYQQVHGALQFGQFLTEPAQTPFAFSYKNCHFLHLFTTSFVYFLSSHLLFCHRFYALIYFTGSIKDVLHPNQKIAFCVLSKNYQHLCEK